jgi:hypothetical protein
MAAALIVFVDALPRTANGNYCARRCACWMVVHSLTLWLLSRGGAFSAVALLMP